MDAPVIPLTPEQVQKQDQETDHAPYLKRLLIAADDFSNVLIGGSDDETISAHMARLALKHEFVGVIVSRALDFIEANHGAKAIIADEERAKLVVEAEQNSGALAK